MHATTTIFLLIGASAVVLAVLALFGGSVFDIGDGIFSIEAVAGFIGGLGFGAAAAYELFGDSVGVVGAAGIGIMVAVPGAFLAARIFDRIGDMPTDATPTAADLVSLRGVVVTPIPAEGFGEIRARVGGQPMKLYARAAKPIPTGVAVIIIESLSETSVIVKEAPSTNE